MEKNYAQNNITMIVTVMIKINNSWYEIMKIGLDDVF